MFEEIGLIIATCVLFALAAIVSGVLAGLTWLLLRKREAPLIRLTLFAAFIPVATAAYLWLCVALLPSESLFGDIAEPLPNGCTLQALGKMVDYGSLDCPKNQNGPSEYIGKVAVYGPIVVGQYSHQFDGRTNLEHQPYFVFDTRDGKNIDVPTLDELQSRLGRPVQLTEVQFFRSQEPTYLRQQRSNRTIEFGPPILAVAILMAFVFRAPRETAT